MIELLIPIVNYDSETQELLTGFYGIGSSFMIE